MFDSQTKEIERLAIQCNLDLARSQSERNRLGQFATPPKLAEDIVSFSLSQLSKNKKNIRFLDPAFGTGSFYSALLRKNRADIRVETYAYEIDPHYANPALKIWEDTGLKLCVGDFTKISPPLDETQKFDLIICNPPYVRHHHLSRSEKDRLQTIVNELGFNLSGLAGFYCYFLLICDSWLKQKGIAAWLIPSEFMYVNYGKSIRSYLLNQVDLIRIHRFDPNDVQFSDALVSSAVVVFRKNSRKFSQKLRFSYGSSLLRPSHIDEIERENLIHFKKWAHLPMTEQKDSGEETRLGDLFEIKRGLATGYNKFFIISEDKIQRKKLSYDFFEPILPSPRFLSTDLIESDKNGIPVIEKRLFLLNCNLPEEDLKYSYPDLWEYIQEGKAEGVNKRFLCSHRTPWYRQEDRIPARFLCTYIGRNDKRGKKPFRFILNRSRAKVTNTYLMLYPKPVLEAKLRSNSEIERDVHRLLNDLDPSSLLGEGRVYGGGMHKLEPKELANVKVGKLAGLLDIEVTKFHQLALNF